MTRVKKIFALTIALALVFALCGPSSYALSPQQFGAWIASALTAINITYQSTIAPMNSFVDYLKDPFQIVDNTMHYLDYTYESEDDFLERSTLSINGNTVTIDGIEYTDIWLSHDAANKFRVNAFDIENAWDIASESEGTFVSGVGYLQGVPMFNVDGIYRSQSNIIPSKTGTYRLGNVFTTVYPDTQSSGYLRFDSAYNGEVIQSTTRRNGLTNETYLSYLGNTRGTYFNQQRSNGNIARSVIIATDEFVESPFDFNWIAGNIPAEELPIDDGLHLLVPNNPSQWSDSPETQQVINNINNFYQINPEFSPDTDIDLSTPGIVDKLDDLLNLITNIIDLTKPSFGPKGEEPVPPEPDPEPEPEPEPEPYPDPQPVPYPDPEPQPGTSLPDLDWTELFDVLKNIFQKIANIDVTSQTIANKLVEFRNRFEDWMKNIRDLLKGIKDDILNSDKEWFEDIVDSIKVPFLPILNIFKSGVSIWHYVVEWLTAISSPFSLFFNIIRNINTIFVTPIYAAIAGTIVLAIYKKFGR